MTLDEKVERVLRRIRLEHRRGRLDEEDLGADLAYLEMRFREATQERDRALEEEARSQAEWRRLGTASDDLRLVVEEGCRRIEQLLLVIDHADQEHDGKLMDHEGEVRNARLYLVQTSRP